MSNVFLGAVSSYDGGLVEDSDGNIIKLPTRQTAGGSVTQDAGGSVLQTGEFIKPSTGLPPVELKLPGSGGSDISIPLETPEPVELPSESPETPGGPSNKKNLLLFGIAGIVLAYLLIRKK